MLKSAGAKGGRPKKAAAADVVLQQPAAELPVKGAAVLGRPPKRKDANPRVRRGADQITCAEAVAAGLQKPLGKRFFCLQWPLSFACSFAASKQSREARPCVFQCNAFCLKREQVKQEFVFFNTRSL